MFYSQGQEDHFLFEKYLGYRNGFFIELGAMNGITYSNTKFFEDQLNWTGILIEPTNQFSELILNRPACYNYNFAVSEKYGVVEFVGNNEVGGIVDTMSHVHKNIFGLEKYMIPSLNNS